MRQFNAFILRMSVMIGLMLMVHSGNYFAQAAPATCPCFVLETGEAGDNGNWQGPSCTSLLCIADYWFNNVVGDITNCYDYADKLTSPGTDYALDIVGTTGGIEDDASLLSEFYGGYAGTRYCYMQLYTYNDSIDIFKEAGEYVDGVPLDNKQWHACINDIHELKRAYKSTIADYCSTPE